MIGGKLSEVVDESLAKHPRTAERWVLLSHEMYSRYRRVQATLNQSDGILDTILRTLEAEQLERLGRDRAHQQHEGFWPPTLQILFSRLWVLSTYETLRTMKQTAAGRSDPALQAVYERFRIVRIPLAKMEVAGANRLGAPLEIFGDGTNRKLRIGRDTRQILPTTICPRTGSVVWEPIDTTTQTVVKLSRLELSDELLSIYPEVVQ